MQRLQKKMNRTNSISDWERLESVIRWAQMTINGFGVHIGLPRAENLYQIKAGKNGISRALATRIVEHFPEVSLGWLLSGEGDMFGRRERADAVPFYDGDLGACRQCLREREPDGVFSLPAMVGCDLAVRSSDDAMADEVMVGSILFLKQIGIEAIISGALYVIVCPSYVILRRARLCYNDAGQMRLKLEPANKNYDEMIVSPEQVDAIYRVVGSFRMY